MKNCLCHLSPVFKGETDPSRQKDRVKKGGDEWLGELSHHERCRVLGIEGAKAWEKGQGDWREDMRGYSADVMGTRLTETAGRGKIVNKGGVDIVIHSELAIVKDNGLKNDYRVNYELVNSKAYHDKFVGLTGSKALNQGLYLRGAKMLSHRSGDDHEDIAMLDLRTGRVIVDDDTATGTEMRFKCCLTKEKAKKLYDDGRYFEILHNHPNSTIPSTDDICGLFNRPKAVGSTIIGHDGSVYRMKKNKPYDNINKFIENVRWRVKTIYGGWPENLVEIHASKLAIDILVENGYMSYIER